MPCPSFKGEDDGGNRHRRKRPPIDAGFTRNRIVIATDGTKPPPVRLMHDPQIPGSASSLSHPCGVISMKLAPFALAAAAVLNATGASAQTINLSGAYRCIEGCRADNPAFVTQNGYELNLVNEAGASSRAWPDAFAPASRIWPDNWNMSPVYSPAAMAIHFANETIYPPAFGP